MTILKLLLFNINLGLVLTVPVTVRAADQPSVALVSAFNVNVHDADGQSEGTGDSPQVVRAAKHQLYLPNKTPIPLEADRQPVHLLYGSND